MTAKKGFRRKGLILLGVFLLMSLVFLFLYHKGTFFILNRTPSPDGSVTTTVYSRMIRNRQFFPKKGGFTLEDRGTFRGRSIFENAEYRGNFWSYDSSYQVISYEQEGQPQLQLIDYTRNIGVNLRSSLESAIYGMDAFAQVPSDPEGRPAIDFQFILWSEYAPSILFFYSYVDSQGVDQAGYCWFHYESNTIDGISPLPRTAVTGRIKAMGSNPGGMPYYIIEPDNGDGDLIFDLPDTARRANFDTLSRNDRVTVVYQPRDLTAPERELLNLTGKAPDSEAKVAAISVTKLS